MHRVRTFAFAVACMMVAPAADAQGNRGNSNGVPGSIASVQAVVDAVLAQIATLPNFAALQTQLAALQTQLNSLSATVAGLSGLQGQINDLNGRLGGLESQFGGFQSATDTRFAGVNNQLTEIRAAIDAVEARGMAALVAEIADAKAEVEQQIAGVRTDLNTLDGDLSPRVDALETSLQELEATVGGLVGSGGAATPVIWSGGCSTAGSGGVGTWIRYCTDSTDDFSTAAGHIDVTPSGVFTARTGGLYRLTYWSTSVAAVIAVRVVVNGHAVSVGQTGIASTSSGFLRDQSADVTWPLNAGDTFEVHALVGATATNAYLPWGLPLPISPTGATPVGTAGSRLQVEYVGPLPD